MAYEAPLKKAIDKAGGPSALARKLGIGASAVTQWTKLPAKWLPLVSSITGISQEEIRPDLYARVAQVQSGDEAQAA